MLPISIKSHLTETETTEFRRSAISIFQKTKMPKGQVESIVNELFTYYSEPHRAYHNLSHLQNLFRVLERAEVQPEHPVVFQLAILFHDVIYEIGRKDNEAKSASLAAERMNGFLTKEELNLLIKIIESTAHHQPLSDERDIHLFLDCDLSILAAPTDIYKEYQSAIRQEYRKTPLLLYRPGRRKVLRHFLERERIYFTDYFLKNTKTQRGSTYLPNSNL